MICGQKFKVLKAYDVRGNWEELNDHIAYRPVRHCSISKCKTWL